MMESVNCLRADHALLRKKCLLLESVVQSSPEGRLVVAELTHSLQRLLEDHLRREDRILQIYANQQAKSGEAAFTLDHRAESQILHGVHQLLWGRMKASQAFIIMRLSQAVEQLQAQMTRQERLIFPFVDEALLNHEAGSMPVHEAMSVNEVLHRYPSVRQIFDDLRVNRVEEGSDSVEEIAWRHGFDVSDVLERLRHAIADVPSYWYGE